MRWLMALSLVGCGSTLEGPGPEVYADCVQTYSSSFAQQIVVTTYDGQGDPVRESYPVQDDEWVSERTFDDAHHMLTEVTTWPDGAGNVERTEVLQTWEGDDVVEWVELTATQRRVELRTFEATAEVGDRTYPGVDHRLGLTRVEGYSVPPEQDLGEPAYVETRRNDGAGRLVESLIQLGEGRVDSTTQVWDKQGRPTVVDVDEDGQALHTTYTHTKLETRWVQETALPGADPLIARGSVVFDKHDRWQRYTTPGDSCERVYDGWFLIEERCSDEVRRMGYDDAGRLAQRDTALPSTPDQPYAQEFWDYACE